MIDTGLEPTAREAVRRQPHWLVVTLVVLLGCGVGRANVTKTPAADASRMIDEARDRAIEVLLTASRGDDPFLRANAIEAMQHARDRVLPVAELGLRDAHPVVRYAALVTIGKLKARSQVTAAEQMIHDEHPSVRAAAYFAARQCGSTIDISPLAQMLFHDNPDVRANAAVLLGWMGDTSAGQMLAEAAQAPMGAAPDVKVILVRSQIAEARVRLGDYEAIDALRAGLYSFHPEVRMLSVGALASLGDVPRVEDALFAIYRDREELLELRLASAAALVEGSRPVVVKEVLDDLKVVLDAAKMAEPALRAQAAVTLGAVEEAKARVRPLLLPSDPASVKAKFHDTASTAVLIGLLEDADSRVRVSAGAAVLRADER